jgi:alpha-D-ribose 1-methylphosphonate 5-triphosphate synthase subunit PhnH
VSGVLAGLADPVLDGQRIFRAVLDAMAHPGRVIALDRLPTAPAPLHAASAAVCLALVDFETPVWLDAVGRTPEVVEHLRFHCGCPLVEDPERARFAVVADPVHLPDLERFDAGTDEYPDRSATVIVQTRTLAAGAGKRLTGPGIESERRLDADGLPAWFWNGLRSNHARFPRGVDVLLTAGASLAALPRTTRAEG